MRAVQVGGYEEDEGVEGGREGGKEGHTSPQSANAVRA